MRLTFAHRSRGGRISAALLLVAAAAVVCLLRPSLAQADESVVTCGPEPDYVFQASSSYGMGAQATCPGGQLQLSADAVNFKQGQGVIWQANAPSGLTIDGAAIPSMNSEFVNDGNVGDYGGYFYWNGNHSNIRPNETSALFGGLSSRDFGFLLVCGKPTCNSPNLPLINVNEIVLGVRETSGPVLSAPWGLWQAPGWIRGTWTLAFTGDSPSGMCALTAEFANQTLPGTSSTRNPAAWHQCSAAAVNDPVNTAGYPDGADRLQIGGTDAAAVPASVTETVYIDNQQPMVTLSGPTDVPSSAGTQNVTATATAGPSGVAGIACSIDGSPERWYPSSTAQVAVSGVGQHTVQCYSENNAEDANGVHGISAAASHSIKIGTPTLAVLAFSRLVDKLRCHHAIERVRIPARWVTVRYHGKPIRVHDRAHTERVKVTHCHVRTARRRVAVWVTVHRHGRTNRVKRHQIIRVLLRPHFVYRTRRVVGYGRSTIVNGWLGTNSGIALGRQVVDVLTAPDNGRHDYHIAAVSTTAANGAWIARLPAGPSRLVAAYYPGAASTQAALTSTIHVVVPAKVELLRVTPRKVAWGGTVRLVGQLKGGYLPPGGALVRLRIGQGASAITYGVHEHVGGKGRFTTTYTFGAGQHSVHRSFWFQFATLPMGDYPYAPAPSRRLAVTVGGHP
jgi:hypothetical protein